jgi:hypothetical protein
LSSAIARKRPIANETARPSRAKTNVQANTRQERLPDERVVDHRLKLLKPTCVFQPGSSAPPSPLTNEPLPLSRKTLPSLERDERVRFAS